MPIATHEISLQGLAGGIFWTIMVAIIFYVLGFATVGWEHNSYGDWVGLWNICRSSSSSSYSNQDWFKATQAMITIGLIFLIGCVILIFLYMFIHSMSLSKNLIIKIFAAFAFFAVVVMIIGFAIFGSKHNSGDLNWSFAFCVIGAVHCFVAGILAIVQMKQSNVI